MIPISHILVLSQPRFLELQLRAVLAGRVSGKPGGQ